MQIHELTVSECREVLKNTRIGRLACARDNQPYVVPVHVHLDGDYLYSFATLGQKIAWMRENPKVCVQVDAIRDQFHWTTVVVFGRYDELIHMPSLEAARQRARELFEGRPEWWQPASTKSLSQERGMPVIFRIQIDRVTGRRAEHHEDQAAGRPWWLSLLFESPDAGPGEA
jgi:uncharacterized protein